MAGLAAVTVDPTLYEGSFSEDLKRGAFYQQHLGEEHAGVGVSDGRNLTMWRNSGLFMSNFGSMSFEENKDGIAYCGGAKEPFDTGSPLGDVALCFSGNVQNREEVVAQLQTEKRLVRRGDDAEVMTHLIAQGDDVPDGIAKMAQRVEGAFAALVLTPSGTYAAVSATGHWPLILGKKRGAAIVASECGGFGNLGFDVVRDMKPGEVTLLHNGHFETRGMLPRHEKGVQICSFLWVYTAFPNATIFGVPAWLVRKRLGAALARRDIAARFIPHRVMPICDSGRYHAIGYYEEFVRAANKGEIDRVPIYDEPLVKVPHAGWSFRQGTDEQRRVVAHYKQVPLYDGAMHEALLSPSGPRMADILRDHLMETLAIEIADPPVLEDGVGIPTEDEEIAVLDDSIVRGSQTEEDLAPKIRAMGFAAAHIHLRISNPELLSHCPWGKTTKRGEVLVVRVPDIQARAQALGVGSLAYNTTDDLVAAIGFPAQVLCMDCSTVHEE